MAMILCSMRCPSESTSATELVSSAGTAVASPPSFKSWLTWCNRTRVESLAPAEFALGCSRSPRTFAPEKLFVRFWRVIARAYEWLSQARTRQCLTALLGGFDDQRLDRQLGELSGGERRRVELAALVLDDVDVLILDEPTNHLDIEAVAWLATYLRSQRSLALVVVTHDRWFLDEISDRTWEVVNGSVEEYDGGYSAFVLAKAERARQASTEQAKRNNLIRKELAWLRRGAPPEPRSRNSGLMRRMS